MDEDIYFLQIFLTSVSKFMNYFCLGVLRLRVLMDM